MRFPFFRKEKKMDQDRKILELMIISGLDMTIGTIAQQIIERAGAKYPEITVFLVQAFNKNSMKLQEMAISAFKKAYTNDEIDQIFKFSATEAGKKFLGRQESFLNKLSSLLYEFTSDQMEEFLKEHGLLEQFRAEQSSALNPNIQ